MASWNSFTVLNSKGTSIFSPIMINAVHYADDGNLIPKLKVKSLKHLFFKESEKVLIQIGLHGCFMGLLRYISEAYKDIQIRSDPNKHDQALKRK